jgi:hypothetical protein
MSFPTKKKRGGKNASRAELDAITLPHHKNKKLIDDDDGSVLLHLLTRLSVRQPSKMIKKRKTNRSPYYATMASASTTNNNNNINHRSQTFYPARVGPVEPTSSNKTAAPPSFYNSHRSIVSFKVNRE